LEDACSFPLQHVIARPFVFLFSGAIMGSAWLGGAFAGFLAVILSSVVFGYFFIPPFFSVSIAKESQSFFGTFILCAIAREPAGHARKRSLCRRAPCNSRQAQIAVSISLDGLCLR
jgi:K+-sensing histidine kinase KdpD